MTLIWSVTLNKKEVGFSVKWIELYSNTSSSLEKNALYKEGTGNCTNKIN